MFIIKSKKDLLETSATILKILGLIGIIGLMVSSISNSIIGKFEFFEPKVVQTPITDVLKSETKEYWANSEDIVWNVQTSEKVIALTFDDGPDPEYTPQILNILKRNGVRATFFVVGKQIEANPQLSKKITANGNEIANHTYSHKHLRGVGPDIIHQELQKAHQVIVNLTQQEPALFRPPGGYYNKTIVDTAKKAGYKVILWTWTQQTNDWTNPKAESIVKKVLSNAKKGDIVIFHDRGGDRSPTVKSLQPIINGLKEQGFTLVTVSELLRQHAPSSK